MNHACVELVHLHIIVIRRHPLLGVVTDCLQAEGYQLKDTCRRRLLKDTRRRYQEKTEKTSVIHSHSHTVPTEPPQLQDWHGSGSTHRVGATIEKLHIIGLWMRSAPLGRTCEFLHLRLQSAPKPAVAGSSRGLCASWSNQGHTTHITFHHEHSSSERAAEAIHCGPALHSDTLAPARVRAIPFTVAWCPRSPATGPCRAPGHILCPRIGRNREAPAKRRTPEDALLAVERRCGRRAQDRLRSRF